MKKLLTLLAAMLILTGCANKEASLSTNDVIFTVGKSTVKQNQLFHTMKATDAGSLAIEQAQNIITQDITDEQIQAQVDELLTKQKDDLKDQFLEEIQKLGFDTEEEYVENNLKPYVRMKVYLEKEMNENFEHLAQKLVPRKVAILEIKTKEKADEALALLEAGSSLTEIAEELDQEISHTGEEVVEFLEGSKLPSVVTTFIKENNEAKTSGILETTAEEKQYFIVSVIESDVNSFKEEIIEKALTVSTVTQTELARIYKAHGFKVFDEVIYKALQKTHPTFLAN